MGRTFTESARRRQIVEAAIEVIAETGYAKASFARIAEQAGLSSTGMISYYFAGKDDLMREVVTEVLRVSQEYMLPRVTAAVGPRARLRVSIESNVELVSVYPKHLAALIAVLAGLGPLDQSQVEFAAGQRAVLAAQEQAVREAQAAGEFGAFDPAVLVTAVRGAIDALVVRAVAEPGLNIAAAARELADLFDRATRPPTTRH
ncbi:TetR/AcrR family transcriptional regulator [Kitasatospora sp. CMC57]|uniref:TetR/AcrR family transcriptional regulator n=1 Tax=Kitasatospora sp. CMC57 TaxID=3231513 RepID=A0AB33JX16_9ACTN